MTGDLYIQSVIDHVPAGMALRDHIAIDLRNHIAERTAAGQPIEEVLRGLGDPLRLAESYLAAVPLQNPRVLPRIAAKLVDAVVVCAIAGAVVGGVLYGLNVVPVDFVPLVALIVVAFTFPLYTALMEYAYGQTLGKMLMKLHVVRESGARIGFGQSLVRQLPFFLQVFWIDALFALFTDRRQRAFELLTKTRAVAVLLSLLLLPMTSAGQSSALDVGTPLGRLVDIGGRKLHLHCTGSGSPTVVIESGASSFAVDWVLVQPQVAKTTRVCSYDRAGMGWSDAGEPELVSRVVRDLHALLKAADEKPPYVLVGASRGGLYTRMFQRRHPTEVAGLVQIDPAHEARLYTMLQGSMIPIGELTAEQLLSTIPAGRPPLPPARSPQTGAPFDRLPPDILPIRVEFERRLIARATAGPITRELMVAHVTDEHAALSELLQSSRASHRPLGDLPLVVLSRGLTRSPEREQAHASLAAQSSRGRHQVIEGSYHEIHLSHPEAVVGAIHEVIALARR